MIDPERWTHGLNGAIARMRDHVQEDTPPPKFDARDREALAFLLNELSKLRQELENGCLRKVS